MTEENVLRSAVEVQRAHDLMLGVIESPELRRAICGEDRSYFAFRVALDVLCWALQHDHNPHFEANLAWITAVARMHGFELADTGELHRRTEERNGTE